MSASTSTKPYLLRALYEWCVDNGFTPYLSVTVSAHTRVPMEYVRDGEIVLNIGPLASNRLQIGQETVEFAARFGGVARDISIPMAAVTQIFAHETGQGMVFPPESAVSDHTPGPSKKGSDEPLVDPPKPGGRPMLRRIK
jgi:stringent starvation protein B